MKRGDWAVAAVILSLIVAGSVFLFSAKKADIVVITVEEREIYRARTDIPATIQAGEGNVIVIESGKAYMLYANCGDQICVHTALIEKAGQSIICLPNGVAVRMEIGATMDSISY